MNKTALITGASSGIGLEFAKTHARHGDDLILVARSIDKLNEIKRELETTYQISITTIQKDLSKIGSPQELFDELKQKQIQVDYLINNAGFGDYGLFHETSWEKTNNMIQLNITSLTHLSKLFLNEMIKRKDGKILNVASTAAFQPGPTMAVYFATKSYVLSFTEAIANEAKEFGVTVTALCPGATESGFQAAASLENSSLFEGKKLPSSKEVAEYGYRAMLKGKVVAIHGTLNYILANSVRFIPRNIVTKISKKFMEAI